MRILHVSDCFPPRLGGIETQVANFAEEQRRRGHEVKVVTLVPGPDDETVTRLYPHINGGVLLRFGSTGDIKDVCGSFNPEIIHAHVGSGAWLAWAAVKFARKNRVPLVLSVHSIWGELARIIYRGRLRPRNNFRVICVSEQARKSIPFFQNATVIANGLMASDWNARISKSETLTFITASRLVKRKRLLELVKMFSRLHRQYPDHRFELRIAGDGPIKSRLVKHLHGNSVPSVKLLGRISRIELQQEYAKAHAYIQLSKLEAFGLAAAEAQASGLPVIGLQESGISDFVEHDKDGFLGKDDYDVELFLAQVIENPTILKGMSNNIEVMNKPYQWNRVLEQYEQTYQDVRGAF